MNEADQFYKPTDGTMDTATSDFRTKFRAMSGQEKCLYLSMVTLTVLPITLPIFCGYWFFIKVMIGFITR
jgi:hypothetical protein